MLSFGLIGKKRSTPIPPVEGYYVKNGGTRTSGQSITSDWTVANCYANINAAIGQTPTDGVVVIADDTYVGAGNAPFEFAGKACTVRSLLGAGACIIDAQDLSRHSYLANGEGPGTIVDGLTLTRGFASDWGGSIRTGSGVAPTIKNCTFSDCNAGSGGGALNIYFGDASIEDCLFNTNSVTNAGSVGGAMRVLGAAPTIKGCTFTGNSTSGAAAGNDGGGMYINSSGIVEDCIFDGNTASHGGAGISAYSGSPTIRRCIIRNNVSAVVGGGIHTRNDSAANIQYCLIHDNTCGGTSSASDAAAISTYQGGTVNVDNCTIFNNTSGNATNASVSAVFSPTNLVLRNTIIIPSSGGVAIVENGATATVTYSDIEGGWTGTGNIDADPLFTNPVSDDYTLTFSSPCKDTGIAIVGVTDGNDLAGNPVDATPDMGCYEYIP